MFLETYVLETYVFLLEYKKVQSANNNNYYDFNDITAQSFQNHFKDKFSCNVETENTFISNTR